MLHDRFKWHERIKAVEREYRSARVAVDSLLRISAKDPQVLGQGPKPRDLAAAAGNLQGTYIVRMFAEFETGVRSYWRVFRPEARTPAEVLLDRVAARQHIPFDILRNAHAVRDYRNKLVHDRDTDVQNLTIQTSRSNLQIYFARLPLEWDS